MTGSGKYLFSAACFVTLIGGRTMPHDGIRTPPNTSASVNRIKDAMDGISETDRIGRIAAAPCAACGKGLTNCAGYHEGQC